MTAPRVVVETPRSEPCTYAGCVVPHMDRRVLQAGEYILIEKVDGEWPKGVVGVVAFASLLNGHRPLTSLANAILDALVGGSP